jgi:flavin-dependent dehydrogenase
MSDHDVLIVGARVAGAATAVELARLGRRVRLIDREPPHRHTLSTHALMQAGVLRLAQLGVLPKVIDAGTPPIDRVTFHYGDRAVPVDVRRPLYAPRRTLLDPLLVDAARNAGVDVELGLEALACLRDPDGRVVGVRARGRDGQVRTLRATVTVGADGPRSRIARDVAAPVTRHGQAASAFAYAYFRDVVTTGYEWCFGSETAAGVIPTDTALACVWIATPPARFLARLRHDLDRAVPQVLAETTTDVAARVAAGTRVSPTRGFPGTKGWIRRPWGPGWALVGDAAYFKDPITAHGMTDALRDAALLADAVEQTLRGEPEARAMAAYEQLRDQLSVPLFDTTEAIASYDWSLSEVQSLHLELSDAMKREVSHLRGRRSPAAA